MTASQEIEAHEHSVRTSEEVLGPWRFASYSGGLELDDRERTTPLHRFLMLYKLPTSQDQPKTASLRGFLSLYNLPCRDTDDTPDH